MQPFRLLRAASGLRLPAWLARGSPRASENPLALADESGDAAVCALSLNEQSSAVVRLERRAGSARLHLCQAASGSPKSLQAWRAEGWFDQAQAVLVLDSEQRHFLTLDRPEAPASEWPLIARYPLAEAMEVEPDAVLATATRMPLINDALRPQMLGMAASLGAVREQLAFLADAGIKVRSIDVADTALRGMVLLQEQPEEGCIALALMGNDVSIGLIWQYQFCALRSLALPLLVARSSSEFADQLALQIQRTADHFERQATQLAVRSVLASLPSLSEQARQAVLSALPLPTRRFELESALDVPDRLPTWQDEDRLTMLASVAAARLLQPLAQRAEQEAQAREDALQATAIVEPMPTYAPTSGTTLAGAALSPTAMTQVALGQAALAASQAPTPAPLAGPREPEPARALSLEDQV